MKSIIKISERANNIVTRQIESYRAIQSKAGIVLGSVSVVIALFTMVPQTSYMVLEFFKIVAFISAGTCSILMIMILIHRKIKDGFSENTFNEVVNMEEFDFYKFEIGLFLTIIEENDKNLNKMNKIYNWGIILFVCSLLIIITIFSLNSILNIYG